MCGTGGRGNLGGKGTQLNEGVVLQGPGCRERGRGGGERGTNRGDRGERNAGVCGGDEGGEGVWGKVAWQG